MKEVYFHTRNGIYYAQILNPITQKPMSARSTGARKESEARDIAFTWIKNGIPRAEKTRKLEDTVSVEEAISMDLILQKISSKSFDKSQASKIIERLKNRGHLLSYSLPGETEKAKMPFLDFLEEFWTEGKSAFLKERETQNIKIGKTHISYMFQGIQNHWKNNFPLISLEEVSHKELQYFYEKIRDLQYGKKPLAIRTANKIMNVALTALKWAYEKDLISKNISKGFTLAKVTDTANVKKDNKVESRNIIPIASISPLFQLQWQDLRTRMTNYLACTTGMRLGEILALKIGDVLGENIQVYKSYSRQDGIKTTKTKKSRVIPITENLKKEIANLISHNPYGQDPQLFLFYGIERDKIMSYELSRKHLLSNLAKLEVEESERNDLKRIEKISLTFKNKGITFHSWRHTFITMLSTGTIEIRINKTLVGHETEEMNKHYSDHLLAEDLKKAKLAMEDVARKLGC